MDGLFEVYIPKKYISSGTLEFITPPYNLDGIEYAKENLMYSYNEELKLVLIDRIEYINRFLPEHCRRNDWVRIEVLGTEVDKYMSSFFIEESQEDKFAFKDLMTIFLKDVSHFVLVWLAEGDTFNEITQVENITEALQLFDNNSEFVTNGVLIYR